MQEVFPDRWSSTTPSPDPLVLVSRAVRVGWVLAGTAGRLALVWLATRPAGRRAAFSGLVMDLVIHRINRSGPTFIKMAQLLSTRTDLLPPGAVRPAGHAA
jgi:predicted unusual protein kinase regulating ubiquinone biosynthesis (AarF/ABC1/UbiB family)